MPLRRRKVSPKRELWRLRGEERPLRGEPFSEDHLAAHARELASLLVCSTQYRQDQRFLQRFAENAEFLRDAIGLITSRIRDGVLLRPDAEWLLDNFYIVEEQLREIRDDLPRRYYRELPKTDFGEPRVYSLAVELISHTDSVLNEETIVRFVTEFQTESPLSMGEVWAVPIMLRLVLVENLRRITAQILCSHASELKAGQLLEDWVDGKALPLELSPIEEHGSLIFHIIDKLQQDGSSNFERLRELERRLSLQDLTIQQTVHLEHQRQASSQVSIGNVITSMRLISAIDWVAFFERTNITEQILRRDPAGVYAAMDFDSRDRYRHVVEDLTDGCSMSETEIAETVVRLAQTDSTGLSRSNHVGYWLIDQGLAKLESEIGYQTDLFSLPSRFLRTRPNLTFFGGIVLVTLICELAVIVLLARANVSTPWTVIVALLAVVPASELAVGLLNTLITSWLRPRLLPKLDFTTGIPAEHRTVVVVPCLLTGSGEVESLIRRLEMHFIANPDPQLSFALLSDLPDAPQAEMPTDADLINQARLGIQSLNSKYASGEAGPFLLFHRARKWNEQEQVWMGWERKRGKLLEFNHLLRRQSDTSFIIQEGQVSRLLAVDEADRIRFVITLDADTTLPHDAARRLVAAIAHPLNAPDCDNESHRVTSGYVLMQPRVTVNLASAQNSRYAQIFANNPGLDPYATCASDVYQDLFGEGSFMGKGIYDIDAFDWALDDAFPENQILSHDLIEGCHSRVALVSDIELFDNYPQRFEADSKRQHRWVRGDWQIAPWLFPIVPSARGWRKNRLTLLSRWKVFDNLRRSLVAPSLLIFLVFGWFVLPNAAWLFTIAGLLVLAYSMIAQVGLSWRGWSKETPMLEQFQAFLKDLERSALQTIFTISSLPQKAWQMTDAIARTVTRTMLTRRRLLEWTTASEVERQLARKSGASLLHWIPIPALGILVTLSLRTAAIPWALPFLGLWIVSPVLLFWLDSRRRIGQEVQISDLGRRELRIHARRIWAFFESYVGPQDHWLPPDNVQEYPDEKIAHRISPTNEGLYLVSGLVARDLGYIGLQTLTDLWERNLSQWQQFARLQGHFYNWYDTVTLEPLVPRYISTVDSGNLIACLLTIQKGIEDLRTSSIVGSFLKDGLDDTIEMIIGSGELMKLAEDRRVKFPWERFTNSLEDLRKSSCLSDDPRDWAQWAEQLLARRSEIASNIEPLAIALHGANQGILVQIRILLDWLSHVSQEIRDLFPWLSIVNKGILETEHTDGTRQIKLRWLPSTERLQLLLEKLVSLLIAAKSLTALQSLSKTTGSVFSEIETQILDFPVTDATESAKSWLNRVKDAVDAGATAADSLNRRLLAIADQSAAIVDVTDFRVLFNPQRKLFSIGFNLETNRLDGSHYDMLCSEARIASYVAIAKGDVESRHWFRLGRPMTNTAGQLSLLSWGGTMFEYLMPQLFQKCYADSILAQSSVTAVARQQEYGRQRGVPWGISECAFGALAANSDYHYKSFGVPGLGLKRGLSKDLVISPYSTLLALETDPSGSLANIERIQQEGGLGLWGLYEALDYTPERVLAGKNAIVVRCYMAHHQGMSLLSLGNFLSDGDTRRRFHDHALVRSTELLLQERVPASAPRLEPHSDEQAIVHAPQLEETMVSRKIVGVATTVPRLQILSNGQYHVMTTSTGGGYSQFNSLGITRWRSDATRDHWGQFIYVRDLLSNRVWSATYQPTCAEPSRYEAVYSIDKAEFFRRDGQFETQLEVAVSPESNSELRQLRITNNGRFGREIEITSYAEVSLIEPAADLSHTSFQKLFVETEYIPDKVALLAKRRPRDSEQKPIWAVHALSASPEVIATIEFETSRQNFLGRGRTPQRPLALEPGARLTGTTGAVLDPIFALRCRITVPAGESITIAFTTSISDSRDGAIALADQYHDPRGVQRGFELAWAYSQVELRHLHLSPAKMHLYQRLASCMLYPDRGHRPSAKRLQENRLGQRGLWRHGISGSVPMFLVYVTKPEQIELIRECLWAHLYWRRAGLRTELVIINDYPGSYFDEMQERLIELLQDMQIGLDERPAYVFLLRGAQIPDEDKTLLEAVASVVMRGDRGSFARQLETTAVAHPTVSVPAKPFTTVGARIGTSITMAGRPLETAASWRRRYQTLTINELEFWNGFGGFARDGREYHIRLTQGQTTPMPWSNVIANPIFGCLVTESGGGYTWSGNSRENKLTTWVNDPVTDTPSEGLYILDIDTGESFSPIPGLRRDQTDYWVQHGQGYTRFIHRSNNLSQEVLMTIAPDDPVKFVILTIQNDQQKYRQFTVSYFAEWVLGVCREETQMHISTSVDEKTGALLARNPYHPDSSAQIAFLHVLHGESSVTGDRTEFLGRNGSVAQPAAVRATKLSGHTGAGLDPCGAVQAVIRIAPKEELEIVFLLGAAGNSDALRSLLARYSTVAQVHQACQTTVDRWNQTLETIEVKTPDRAFDLIVNRWLLYQTLSCRVLGRSAYYQCGGAFGFRDQLQDVMALVYSRPEIARAHILKAASRQFEEGDVQHWWHPPDGQGTRTRFSDDLLWLPFAVCHYLAVTNDESILDQDLPFLHSPLLEAHQQERYETPEVSTQCASLYEHCCRTIEYGFKVGIHGIPLMGCGDWNDGMNKVGEAGRGESVWMGWFLLVVLDRFVPIMKRRGDSVRTADLEIRMNALRKAMEDNAWDGEWYRRAYFDDETPLGSAQNDECQIDSIAQTWAVIAGGDRERSRQAIESVMNRLVQWKAGVVLLFTPPFNQSLLDPGYIKGYVPGIRENGGQYTHSCTWLIQALALLKDGDRAVGIFELVNPVNHSITHADVTTYQVEPYVVAADVYSVPPHTGRGGWTWYTGSASWLYRAAIEFILGFQLRGNTVSFDPQIPDAWNRFELRLRRGTKLWTFQVVRPNRDVSKRSGPSPATVHTGAQIVLETANPLTEVVIGPQSDRSSSLADTETVRGQNLHPSKNNSNHDSSAHQALNEITVQ